MRFEIIECAGEWIVRRDGVELARLGDQDAALERVAAAMRETGGAGRASLSVSYEPRSAPSHS